MKGRKYTRMMARKNKAESKRARKHREKMQSPEHAHRVEARRQRILQDEFSNAAGF